MEQFQTEQVRVSPVGDVVDYIPNELEPLNADPFYYTIVAASRFRANSMFKVMLTAHRNLSVKAEIPGSIMGYVSIEDEDNEKENAYKTKAEFEMRLDHTEILFLDIGDVPESHYKLVVRGVCGITIEREASLDLQTRQNSILIQTDKAIYKPSDKILFRVLVLDSALKPAANANGALEISFTDPARNVVKKWKGQHAKDGVFSNVYHLSDVPILGEWKICAKVGEQEKTVILVVAEYVLPKFEVSIESPHHFSVAGKILYADIRAKYTYGKPLKGKAMVSVTEEDNWGCFGYRCMPNDNDANSNALIRKAIDLDGIGHIEFDIEKELKQDDNERNQYYGARKFKIKAEVVETLTGLSQIAEKTVSIHTNSYNVAVDLDRSCLKRDSTIDMTISVKNHDDSRLQFTDSKKKKLSLIRERFYSDAEKGTTSEDTYELNDSGDAFIQLKIDKEESQFSLKIIYMSEESEFGNYYTTKHSVPDRIGLNARILNEKCVLGERIDVEISSHYPFSSYTYFIVSLGKIIDSKTVCAQSYNSGDAPLHTHRFAFWPEFDYAPRATIVIYYMKDDQLVSTSVCAEMYDDFKNSVELDVVGTATAKPGQRIDLRVKSNPNATIGLLGYDKSLSILRSGNDLTRDDIWNELEMLSSQVKHREYDYMNLDSPSKRPIYFNPWSDFSNLGLITFSNAMVPIRLCRKYHCEAMACNMLTSSGFKETKSAPRIRKNFPETWIWKLIPGADFSGVESSIEKVPDSLTTWVLTAFSIDPINGLSITKKPTYLQVEQPFIISVDLPYSVKRGECIKIPCSIFNYTPNDVDAEVIFERLFDDCEFVDEAIDKNSCPELSEDKCRKKKISIGSQDGASVSFTIRPLRVGAVSFKVSAISSVESDCVVKAVKVECEGVPQYVNKAVFIDLREKDHIDGIVIPIDIPKIALPDSTHINVTCIDDLLGSTARNLDKLIRLPYGCGEQNMLNFVPNIVILNYFKNIQQLNENIESTAKKFMDIGYQRELTYRHGDGSFSAFGKSDKSGSTWLTAFVARSFGQASDHIDIDKRYIDEALKWLSNIQKEDGSFVEVGSVCHKEMQSGSANGLALTAYVLTAFLVNLDEKKSYKTIIDKALANINELLATTQDIYAVSVATYALHLAEHKSKDDAFSKLDSLAERTDNFKWWQITKKLDKYQSKTLDVEVSAYALLSQQLNAKITAADCLPIVKWLLNQRNDQGGFEGTQDTIVGIEALATFATKIASTNSNIRVNVKAADADFACDFKVDEQSTGILQSQSIPEAKELNINATGKGFALVEVSYVYNIDESEKCSPFVLKPVATLKTEGHLYIELTTSYTPQKENEPNSNMVVCEIALPSGFTVDANSLEKLKKTQELIKRVEAKNGNTVVIIYLDHLTSKAISLGIDAFRDHEVSEQKPASVIIYDYYDNALRGREFYSI